ncbi:low temperature requirement A [Streptococcus suis]|nr:low temperature requirement A [Streptococcus suis]
MSDIKAKRVSNYELFYDLVFVLATSSLTGLLHGNHIGFKEVTTFITANLIIMTLWMNETSISINTANGIFWIFSPLFHPCI